MEKVTIKNRKNQNISVLVEKDSNQSGLAFVMHGLGGFKEQDHIGMFASAFKDIGFTVIRFDTTNTIGESDGKYEDATITNYYKDLEDVIHWAKHQEWYQEPFALSGHSLGGICTAYFAEKHPDQVLALAPISTVVSGKLSIEAHERVEPDEFKKWEKTGWKERKSKSKPGMIKRLPWSHMNDRLKYDLIANAGKLTMPVLLIVGENDTSTPPNHIQQFFNAIPAKTEFHIIKDAPHTFRDKKHLKQINAIFAKWFETILN